MKKFLSRRARWVLLGCCLLGLASCGTVKFYTQAASGQAQILWRSQPIPEVISQADTRPALKAKLERIQQMRAFAKKSLGLPADESFGKYADLGRKYVSWVVYAAPELSVEAKTWWYPLVGRLQYRGYFSEDAAKAEAAKLKAEGLDVFYGGVEAYSTLGWFHDPVLNTFVSRSDADLAELIFHELTHVKLFLPGDTDFNEALATAVGQEGVRRWLRSLGELEKLTAYDAASAKDHDIVQLLLSTRSELKSIYTQPLPAEELRRRKAESFDRMKQSYTGIRQRWKGDSRYDRYFALPMNNARLNTVAAYHSLVPKFAEKLKRLDGDLTRLFAEMEKLRDLPAKERVKAMEE
jgi:predicted aminopeptidase